MANKNEGRPDPLTQGKGRKDEVDQSRGIFPPGVPHPEGAEIRTPGSLGGGPYEESGRGGVDVSIGQSTSRTPLPDEEAEGSGEEAQGGRADERAPKGALPQGK